VRPTVVADTNAPVLLGANSIGLTGVLLRFSEALAFPGATNSASYSLTGTNGAVAILGVSFDSNGTNILLSVAPLQDGARYTVSVSNVTDRAAARNPIGPGAQATFYVTSYVPVAIGNAAPPGMLIPAGTGVDLTGGGAGVLGTSDQCQFGYQLRNGDFDVRVRLESLELVDAWTEAGLMARKT
jgi:hypothetical protein